jgi:hypothetical protein
MNKIISKSMNIDMYGPVVFKPTGTKILSEPLSQCYMGESRVETQLKEVLGCLPPGAMVAGGFLTDTTALKVPKDMDIFFTGAKARDDAHKSLLAAGYRRAEKEPHGCVNLVKDGLIPVQLVMNNMYENVQHLLDGFDFTVTQMAIDGTQLYYGQQTLKDIEEEVIRLHRLNMFLNCTYNHALRYMEKGYRLLPETFSAIYLKKFPVVR